MSGWECLFLFHHFKQTAKKANQSIMFTILFLSLSGYKEFGRLCFTALSWSIRPHPCVTFPHKKLLYALILAVASLKYCSGQCCSWHNPLWSLFAQWISTAPHLNEWHHYPRASDMILRNMFRSLHARHRVQCSSIPKVAPIPTFWVCMCVSFCQHVQCHASASPLSWPLPRLRDA